MIDNALLEKFPLEPLYREMLERYLSLSPTKGEYRAFMDQIALLEKKYANNKPFLRAVFLEYCLILTPKKEDAEQPDIFELDD